MICPECEAEYRPGFDRCADCGVALVEPSSREDEEHPEPGEPAVVFSTADAIEAALVKSLLEGSGIEASLIDEHFSRMESPLSFAIGGVKVVVPQRHEEHAHAVLVEYRKSAGDDPEYGHNSPFNLADARDEEAE